MIEWIVMLFVVGALLIFFETVLPGIIAGIIGGLLMLVGVALAFANYGVGAGFLSALIAVIVVLITLYIEFRVLPRTGFGKKFFLTQVIDGAAPSLASEYAALVGKPAVAATALRPSGVVLVEGRRYEAFSASGYLEKETVVRVTAADSFKVTVVRAI
jgi:membrane-bound serine protease (ClpP class)